MSSQAIDYRQDNLKRRWKVQNTPWNVTVITVGWIQRP